MILLLDTSSPLCKLTFVDGDERYESEWQADRRLANGILAYLLDELHKNDKTFADITGIGAFLGPGSFTGLRIGLAVLNTIANSEHVPIVGTKGDAWQADALERLHAGIDEQILLPFYGGDANITKPRK